MTRQDWVRLGKAFLMVAGSIVLSMVLFAMLGVLWFMASTLAAIGVVMTFVVAPVVWARGFPVRTVFAWLGIGPAVVVGAVAGSFVISEVMAMFS